MKADETSAKELLVAFPIFASAMAISYDVGFFLGLDLHFFTIFSLTEHILFSFEALPIVVIISMITAMLLLSIRTLVEFEFLQSLVETKFRRRALVILLAIPCYYVAYITYSYGMESLFGDFTLLVLGTLIVTVPAAGYLLLIAKGLEPLYLILYIIYASIVLSFSTGFCFARSAVHSASTRYTIETKSDSFAGRLIRSGERGVLFIGLDKRTRIVKWDDIKQIWAEPLNFF